MTGELLDTKNFDMWAGGNGELENITHNGHLVYILALNHSSLLIWCVSSDVSDLLKFLRPLHEGTLVFVASFDDPATK